MRNEVCFDARMQLTPGTVWYFSTFKFDAIFVVLVSFPTAIHEKYSIIVSIFYEVPTLGDIALCMPLDLDQCNVSKIFTTVQSFHIIASTYVSVLEDAATRSWISRALFHCDLGISTKKLLLSLQLLLNYVF